MRHTQINARVPGMSADEAFDKICDFESFSGLGPSIRSVEVEEVDETTVRSKWDVDFRGGSMRWTEEDKVDRAARTMRFHQVEGNLKHFEGSWTVEQDGDDATITFQADFAVGLPSMAAFIDPIAEQSIVENLTTVLRGLFGEGIAVEDASTAATAS